MKNIRSRLLKDLSDACGLILGNIWNEKIVLNKNFPENLKLADVTPILKKKNYIGIMQNYIGKSFSSFLCRYRKGVSESVHSILSYQ